MYSTTLYSWNSTAITTLMGYNMQLRVLSQCNGSNYKLAAIPPQILAVYALDES